MVLSNKQYECDKNLLTYQLFMIKIIKIINLIEIIIKIIIVDLYRKCKSGCDVAEILEINQDESYFLIVVDTKVC